MTFSRDLNTLALLNTDTEGLAAYRNKRERQKKIDALPEEINTIKSEFAEIKLLLQQIIDRG